MPQPPPPPPPTPRAASETLDMRGLRCPLPLMRLTRAMRGLPTGTRLDMLTDDAMTLQDLGDFARATGHAVLSTAPEAAAFRVALRAA